MRRCRDNSQQSKMSCHWLRHVAPCTNRMVRTVHIEQGCALVVVNIEHSPDDDFVRSKGLEFGEFAIQRGHTMCQDGGAAASGCPRGAGKAVVPQLCDPTGKDIGDVQVLRAKQVDAKAFVDPDGLQHVTESMYA